MAEIKCSVQNCGFWGRENVCQAEAIEVAVTGGVGARMDAGQMGGSRAAASEETCCVTFKPRD